MNIFILSSKFSLWFKRTSYQTYYNTEGLCFKHSSFCPKALIAPLMENQPRAWGILNRQFLVDNVKKIISLIIYTWQGGFHLMNMSNQLWEPGEMAKVSLYTVLHISSYAIASSEDYFLEIYYKCKPCMLMKFFL